MKGDDWMMSWQGGVRRNAALQRADCSVGGQNSVRMLVQEASPGVLFQ